MDKKLNLLTQSLGPERFKFKEKLTYHTFSQSKGEAECFYVATSLRELTKILELAFDLKIPYFIIGSGTKVIINTKLKGLVVKNRTSNIKMAGVKGKVSREGIGVEEAYVEADSGVSLNKLNEFVKSQKLQPVDGFSSLQSTIGGAIFLDPLLRDKTQNVKVWEEGEVLDIKLDELKLSKQVVLSVLFKFKAQKES